jgi:hypothetical protein
MKKIFLMVAILFSVATMAQNAVMTFNKTTHDFGKINEADGRVTTVFVCENKGMKPLVITNVKASCGCTTPKWTKEPIGPGMTGEITVTYNPSGRPGRFQKSITITSNASDEPTRLYIKGEVIPKPAQATYAHKIGELSVQRNMVNLGSLTKGSNKTGEIEYANNTDKPIKVDILFESGKVYWKPHLSATILQPKSTGKLQVSLVSNECPLYGPINTKIHFVVNGVAHKDANEAFTFKADIKEDFSKLTTIQKQQAPIIEMVSTVNVGTLAAGKKVSKKMMIKNVGINTMLIRRAYSNDNRIEVVAPKSIKGGKTAELRFDINTTGAKPAQYSREITIITNDPNKPIHKIKVNWMVK